jgi:predicted DNA-binding ribbon-helix-helix protein
MNDDAVPRADNDRRAALQKRSLAIARHRTSVALEPEFWAELERIAQERQMSLARLVSEIDATKQGGLASALRVFVLRALAPAPSGAKKMGRLG